MEIVGNPWPDRLYGTSADDRIFGLEGNDSLDGGSGNDYLDGGGGSDDLGGSWGDDTLVGGDGDDQLYSYVGRDSVYGGPGDDHIDLYAGGFGLVGEARFWGGEGNDTFDAASYGTRLDLLTGGPGRDVYIPYWPSPFQTSIEPDEVTDFTPGPGGDVIRYDALLSGAGGYVWGADPFATGYLRLHQDGADALFQIDWDGQGGGRSWETVLVLRNTAASELILHNFDPAYWYGTEVGERIAGTPGRDIIDALGGNDSVTAAAGNDVVRGAAGDDTLDGGGGNDTLEGGAGADTLLGRGGTDRLEGGEGDDSLNGGEGPDTLSGGEGSDTLEGGSAGDVVSYGDLGAGLALDLAAGTATTDGSWTDTLRHVEAVGGTAFADVMAGTAAAETLAGGDGDDLLSGGGGNDEIDGGDGADTLRGGWGNDVIYAGRERFPPSETGRDEAFGEDGDDVLQGGGIAVLFEGGSGNDTLVGGAGGDLLDGGAGTDRILGGGGDDTVRGGLGNDTLKGGWGGDDVLMYDDAPAAVLVNLRANAATHRGGTDFIAEFEGVVGSRFGDVMRGDGFADVFDGAAGDDILTGDNGDDTLRGGTGNDVLDGGRGLDAADYSDAARAVTVRLATGTAKGATGEVGRDTLHDVEAVLGGSGDDALTGDEAANFLAGGAGGDLLGGGKGDDTVRGGAGDDRLDGGEGDDTADYSDTSLGVTVRLSTGTARGAAGEVGTDVLVDIEAVLGGGGDDRLTGNAAANLLSGGAGGDVVDGGRGDDTVWGGAGDDTLAGGLGNDVINGGETPAPYVLDAATRGSLTYYLLGPDAAPGWRSAEARARELGGHLVTVGDAAEDSWLKEAFASTAESYALAKGLPFADDQWFWIGLTDRATEGDWKWASGDWVSVDYVNWGPGQPSDTEDGLDYAAMLATPGKASYWAAMADRPADALPFGIVERYVPGGVAEGGRDMVDYGAARSGVTVILWQGRASGGAGQDMLVGIEDVRGSQFGDNLHGSAADNEILGLQGNDTISAHGGNDLLDGGRGDDYVGGGAGNDTLRGGLGNDILDGSGGRDTADYSDTKLGVVVSLAAGTAEGATGEVGSDRLMGIETVLGGSGDDAFSGNRVRNLLSGGGGDDTLEGAGGDDILLGGDGADALAGGGGADRFVLASAGESGVGAEDAIADFEAGADRIDLSAIDADATVAGDQAFSFIGTDAFTGAGQLRFVQDAANNRTLVEGNVNADLVPDFQIELLGVLDLTAGDFVL